MDILEEEMTRYEQAKQHLGKIKKYGEIAKEELKLWGWKDCTAVIVGSGAGILLYPGIEPYYGPFLSVINSSLVGGVGWGIALMALHPKEALQSNFSGGCGGCGEDGL